MGPDGALQRRRPEGLARRAPSLGDPPGRWLRQGPGEAAAAPDATPAPILRLRHLLGVLERNPAEAARVAAMLRIFLREVDSAALLADFGFAPRTGLWAEFGRHLRARWLPITPATNDLGELFALLFPRERDAAWLAALDEATLARLARLLGTGRDAVERDWREPFFDAITFLAGAVRASGFSPQLRQRMSAELLVDTPFHQLTRVAERAREHGESAAPAHRAIFLQEVQYLRALLDTCRRCAASVHEHLEAHGVSVDVVFEVDQLRERTHRIDALLTCVLADAPAREIAGLVAELARAAEERRSIRGLFARHYSLLARKVAERSAATGEHYITRDRAEYAAMLRAAAGGGSVLAATTFAKFALAAIGLGVFWGGLAAGVLYAASFVAIQILHFTLATKQPAMTAPAMARQARRRLQRRRGRALRRRGGEPDPLAGCGHLRQCPRRRAAGAGAAGARLGRARRPGGRRRGRGADPGDAVAAGPDAGVRGADRRAAVRQLADCRLGRELVRLAPARQRDRLEPGVRRPARRGAARAQRWSRYWRHHVSGFASNVSLGLMLGLVPAIAAFFSLPLDVRHITLASGQLASAVGALGPGVLATAAFWWCVLGLAATAALNLGVSFLLAFRVALRSRGIRLADQSRIHRAIRARLRRAPLSFVLPPAPPAPAGA